MRVREELRGSSASLRVAAKRSSTGRSLSCTMALSLPRRLANFFAILRRRLFFSIELFFAIRLAPNGSAYEAARRASLPEREVESRQQRARLVVVLGGRADGNVEAPRVGDLVEIDLREHDVLLDAERVVAAAVEALRVETAEVADARQRDIHQAIDEVVHAPLAQRDLTADGLAVAQLVVRDRLARLGDHHLLARDQRQVAGGVVHLLAVGNALADAHVEDDLGDRRHLHRVLVAELLGQLTAHALLVVRAQARDLVRALARRLGLGRARLAGLLRLGSLGSLRRLGRVALRRGALRRGALGLLFIGLRISHRSLPRSASRSAPSCGYRLRR